MIRQGLAGVRRGRRARRLVLAIPVALVLAVLPVGRAQPASAAVAFSGTAINQASGRCMDVPASGSANGLQLIQWSCHGASNQNFSFNPLSSTSDVYTIRTLTAGKCVEVNGASTADNAQI